MAHPVHLAKFEAVSASLNAASPLRALFMRIATHDTSMTSLDFTAALQQEFIRWPEPRQVAALALLIGNPYVTVINLSGLTLPDAGASALAAALHADAGGRVEVLNLERNDLREPGLLNIVGALQSNTTLRELRLTDQRTAVSTAVEMALAEMLDKGGARALIRLGMPLRNDAARRMANAALFRNTDRQRQLRAASSKQQNLGIVPAAGPIASSIAGGVAVASAAQPPLALSSASATNCASASARAAKTSAIERARASPRAFSARTSSQRSAAAPMPDEMIRASAPPVQLWPPPPPSAASKSSHRPSPTTSCMLSPELSPQQQTFRIQVAPTPMPPTTSGEASDTPAAAAGCFGLCLFFGCGRKHAKRAPVSPVCSPVGFPLVLGNSRSVNTSGGSFWTPAQTPAAPSTASSSCSSSSCSSSCSFRSADFMAASSTTGSVTGARLSPPPTAHTCGSLAETAEEAEEEAGAEAEAETTAAATATTSTKACNTKGRSGSVRPTLNPRSSSPRKLGGSDPKLDASTPNMTRPTAASLLISPFKLFLRSPPPAKPAKPATPPVVVPRAPLALAAAAAAAPASTSPRASSPRAWTPRGTAVALPVGAQRLGVPGAQRLGFDPARLTAAEMTEEQRAAAAAFGELLAAKEAADVLHAHAALLTALHIDVLGRRGSSVLTADTPSLLPLLTEALMPLLPHRSRQLLAQLSSRAARAQYSAADMDARGQRLPREAARRRAVIIGGGPIGLRCAIELAFLGLRVEVLESRERFGRLQVLHLWEWVELDLIDLGIKFIDPSIFSGADFRHVQTSQLQHSLLKVAVLLGVTVRFNCKVADPRSLQSYLSASFFTPRPPSPRKPVAMALHTKSDSSSAPAPRSPLGMLHSDASNSRTGARSVTSGATSKKRSGGGVDERRARAMAPKGGAPGEPPDVLVDATGARCELFEKLGLTQLSTRFARATCIVVHLQNHKTVEEMRLPESTWSQQYHQQTFAQLARNGCVLQNIVYYRSSGNFADCATHYFVMTSDLEALMVAGAVRSLSVPEPTSRENVDRSKLEAYARQAISAFVPALAQQPLVPDQLQIFDFSERKSSNRAAILVPGATLGGSPASRVLVTRVGDALQEPFW